jgi:RNA polymerase sigma-70 factor, ECF subfamily
MHSSQTDEELLARSATDPSEFAVLYERHGLAVRLYVRRRVGSQNADDLAAEVFARAFGARERFRAEHDSALPWLLGIATHVVADHRRTEKRRLAALQRLTGHREQAIDQDALPSAELVRELRRLAAPDRDALLLVVWGELSYEEAATALGVPIGTVSSRITRARRHLASAVARTHPSQPTELRTKPTNA